MTILELLLALVDAGLDGPYRHGGMIYVLSTRRSRPITPEVSRALQELKPVLLPMLPPLVTGGRGRGFPAHAQA